MFKSKPNKKTALKALAGVMHPRLGKSVVDLGMVKELTVDGNTVSLVLEMTEADKDIAPVIDKKCQDVLKGAAGFEKVNTILTAERTPPGMEQAMKGSRPAPEKVPVPGVGSVIAVASGKGGVGKSTVAVNLALALKEAGLKVGLLDADIYGPSAPKLLKLTKRPELKDDKIVPSEQYGLKVVSMGLMVDEEAPLIWRGPMVGGAVKQFLYDVDWAGLDVLVVDMPPGTGDAQLTLAQNVPLSGAIIVSTPQDLALIDARKGLEMFRTIHVPILGVIENMSTFVCPHCGEESHVFGHGGARETAVKLNVPFLGEIPLKMAIRETSDSGVPLVVKDKASPEAKAFQEIAEKVKKAF